jgi:hypothetical protein
MEDEWDVVGFSLELRRFLSDHRPPSEKRYSVLVTKDLDVARRDLRRPELTSSESMTTP